MVGGWRNGFLFQGKALGDIGDEQVHVLIVFELTRLTLRVWNVEEKKEEVEEEKKEDGKEGGDSSSSTSSLSPALLTIYYLSREIEDGLEVCRAPPPTILSPCPSCLLFQRGGEWGKIILAVTKSPEVKTVENTPSVSSRLSMLLDEPIVGKKTVKTKEGWKNAGYYYCENTVVDFLRSERMVLLGKKEGMGGEVVLLMGDVHGRVCLLFCGAEEGGEWEGEEQLFVPIEREDRRHKSLLAVSENIFDTEGDWDVDQGLFSTIGNFPSNSGNRRFGGRIVGERNLLARSEPRGLGGIGVVYTDFVQELSLFLTIFESGEVIYFPLTQGDQGNQEEGGGIQWWSYKGGMKKGHRTSIFHFLLLQGGWMLWLLLFFILFCMFLLALGRC